MGRKRKTNKDLPARMYFKHGKYYLVALDKKWISLGADKWEALKRYADLNSTEFTGTTMGDVMDRFLREVVPTMALRTQRDRHKEVANLRSVFGHMHPDSILAEHIYRYMDLRYAPVRANREKAVLSTIFSFAIRWGVTNSNPCLNVRRNPEKPRDRYVTDKEFWAVHTAAPPPVQVAMELALMTGLRQGQLLTLTYRDCKSDGIHVQASKGGKALVFEWVPELLELVERAKQYRGRLQSMYLICNENGQRYSSHGFKSMWRRVMNRALGKPTYTGQKNVAAAVLDESFTFHDIRAKSASDHETGEHLGHQSPKTLNRVYRRKPLVVRPVTPKRKKY